MITGYSIIIDAKKGGHGVAAMVDRSKVKKHWWTAIQDDKVMVFKSKVHATNVLNKLKYNNPRIILAKNCVKFIESQRKEYESRRTGYIRYTT